MIEIQVKEGNIYLKSEYNQEIVSFMRSRPKRFWDRDKRIWIIPETDLDQLLKLVSQYEYTINYVKSKVEDSNIPKWYEFKTKPFQHQIEGVEYGLTHPKFLLADEQGLGKTKTMLDLSLILKKKEGIKHVLIVACVNGLKYNWRAEIEKHTNEKGYILGTRKTKKGREYIGSNEERLKDVEVLETGVDIDKYYYLITNIEKNIEK